jgi:sterol 3beta-glucosyltransferase
MKICIATFGSDGDIQPYLALGKALKASGHEITFHTLDRYQPRVEQLGMRFHLMGKWNPTESSDLGRKMLATRNPAKHIELLYDTLLPHFLAAVPLAEEVVAESDLVVNHVITASIAAAAAKQKKPLVCGHLFPNVIPSPKLSPLGGEASGLKNWVLWGLLRRLLRRATDEKLNRVFAAAGAPSRRDLMLEGLHSSLLNLIAMSPRLLPKETGWPSHYHVTGYWFLEEPDYVPDAALERFLGAGEPPVLVTFGSMSGMDVDKQNRILLEGFALAKQRVIIQSGWAGFGEGQLPDEVHRVGFVPHSWLLTRVRGLIHHGGAGTTAAGLRAGIPQAIVWHLGDQSSWGKQVASLGVGVDPIWYGKLTPRWVAAAIRRLTEDAELAKNARGLGAGIRSENGTAEAVRLIESVGR